MSDPTPDDQALTDLLTTPPTPDTENPFLAGTFALYMDHDGAVIMVTEIEGRGVERHRIPKAMVSAALSFAGGGGGIAGKLGGFLARRSGGSNG